MPPVYTQPCTICPPPFPIFTAITGLNRSAVVLRQLRLLDIFKIIAPSPAMVRRGVEIRNSYRISFWDAGIVAAAEIAECDYILSEDLNTGQYYVGCNHN